MNAKTSLEEVSSALAFVDPEPRDTWIEMGMALHSFDQSPDSFTIWNRWSSRASCYKEKECAYQWRKFREDGNGRKKSLGSLFFRAQQGGYRKNGDAKPKASMNGHLKAVNAAAPPKDTSVSEKLWPTIEMAICEMDSLPLACEDERAVSFFLEEYGLPQDSIPAHWLVFNHPTNGPGVIYTGVTATKTQSFKFKTLARFEDKKGRKKRKSLFLCVEDPDAGTAAFHIPHSNRTLVITGGEEKAAAAFSAGFTAFTTLNGETSYGDWPAYISGAKFPKIIVAMDNDQAGEAATEAWTEHLIAAGVSSTDVFRVKWPEGLPDGYDLTDALKDGALAPLLDAAVCEAKAALLSILSTTEILNYQLSDNDQILQDRLFSVGGSMSILGPGGIGKSRLVMQMLIAIILGREWLGFKTLRPDTKILVLQTENSIRRLSHDLGASLRGMGDHDRDRVARCLNILAPISENDSIVSVGDTEAAMRLTRSVQAFKPEILVVDPFGDFFSGDSENDAVEMRESYRGIKKISQSGNKDCALEIVHHSKSGRSAAGGAVGWDSSSYGRGSKVLHSCVRSQINVAPGDPDDDRELVVACGKNNDGPRFDPIGVTFDPDRWIYEVNYEFNLDSWRESVDGKGKGRPTVTVTPQTVATIMKATGRTSMKYGDLVMAIIATGICRERKAKDAIKSAVEAGKIVNNSGHYSPA